MSAPSAASPNVATLTKQLLTALRAERALHDHLLRLTAEERTAITGPTKLALLGRTQALADANTANAELLTHALGATRASLGYLRALQGARYHPDGRLVTPATPPHRLDRQA